MKLEVIDGKQTNWGGLWYHPDTYSFSSQAIDLSELRKFKGNVTLVVRKNRFYNNGESTQLRFSAQRRKDEQEMAVEDGGVPYKDKNGDYFDENGERLYTYAEVKHVMRECAIDIRNGIDEYDCLVEDYIG